MIRKNIKLAVLSAWILTVGLQTGFAQDEYDDMYFSAKDRKKIKYAEQNTDANITYQSYSNNTYNNASYSAKEVNPEYIEKYKQQARESVAEEMAAADQSTNPSYSSQDYYVEEFDNEHDNPSFYNDPKYNRQSEPTVVNNYYGGGYGNPYRRSSFWGPSMMMGYNSWAGWSYGMSFGWGSPGYYDPFFYDPWYYDPFYCPMYSYNSYRWYNRGYYNGYYNGYYMAGGIHAESNYPRVTRGARYSRGSNVARNENISRMSLTRPTRSTSRSEVTASNGRMSSSTQVATNTSSRARVAASTTNRGSQNEYIRKANVSTSRSRLSDVSNRVNSRSAVTTRTPYSGSNVRTSSTGRTDVNTNNSNNYRNSVRTSENTRSNRSYSNSSGNQRRYNTQRSSSSYSSSRSSAPSRSSYSSPSPSRSSGSSMRSSPSRSSGSGRSSGSSSRSSRGNR